MEMLSQGHILASRYEIVRLLSDQGGMGMVYVAWDQRLEAFAAVKENLFREADMEIAFRREAQILANLNHPALPHVIDYFFADGRQYLVMEIVEGDDLSTLLSKTFPIAQGMEWARQLLEVLEYLHGQPTSILHRDIKPSNIKIRNNRLVLLDFGLAYGQIGKMPVITPEQFNWSGHSRKYSSLEQSNAQPTSPASDLYSAAATLYALFTGSPPHNSQVRSRMIKEHKGDPLEDIGLVRPELDRGVSQAIMKALELEMARRPQSATEMRRMMFPEPTLETPPPRGSYKWLVASLCAAILLLGIIIGLIITNRATIFRRRQAQLLPILTAYHMPPPNTPHLVEMTLAERATQLAAEATIALQAGEYLEATRKAAAAAALAPDDVYVKSLYGDVLWDASDELDDSDAQKKKYLEVAKEILASCPAPQTAKEHTARAWAYLALEKNDLAFDEANKALSLESSCIEALMIRATANKDNAASLTDYDTVIELRPHDVQALLNRAATYINLKKYEEAIADYDQAIGVMPRASFYSKRGRVYKMMSRFEKAIEDFTEAIKHTQNAYGYYVERADAYAQLGRWDAVIEDCSFVIENAPTKARNAKIADSLRDKAYQEATKERLAKAD